MHKRTLLLFILMSLLLGERSDAVRKDQVPSSLSEDVALSQRQTGSSQYVPEERLNEEQDSSKTASTSVSKASGVLNLKGLGIDRSNALAISMTLRDKATQCSAVDLSDNAIDDICAWTLAESFSYHPQIVSLSFYNNAITDEGAKFISNLQHLKVLDLGKNNISDKGALVLSGLANLVILNLPDNQIGFEGFKVLAESFGSPTKGKRIINLKNNPLYTSQEEQAYLTFTHTHELGNLLLNKEELQEKDALKGEENSHPSLASSTLSRSESVVPLEQESRQPSALLPTPSFPSYTERVKRLKEELNANKIDAVAELIALYQEAGLTLKETMPEEEIQDMHDLAGRVLTTFQREQKAKTGQKLSQQQKPLPSLEAFHQALQHVLP